MRKWMSHIISVTIVATVLLTASGVHAEQAQSNPTNSPLASNHDHLLKSNISGWVSEIAKQPSFESWKNAKFDVTPLGPGTHSWLAIVQGSKGVLGYLVIQALEDGGFVLGEYGLGSYLYNETTLLQSMKQLELIPSKSKSEILYVHPLLAVWKINSEWYIDAMSGELLPLDKKVLNAAMTNEQQFKSVGLSSGRKLKSSLSNPSFGPYAKLPWVVDKPMQVSSTNSYKAVSSALDAKKQLRYTVERYNEQMLYVWSVTGYHNWDETAFVALETNELGESRRYIPLQLLTELGQFYY
ncbi:MAG: hypothetical protein ACE3L7_12270 [Candidatus Pristimantibacillus sp.]